MPALPGLLKASRNAHRVAVRFYSVVDLFRITAAHRSHGRDASRTASANHEFISPPESFEGESQLAEAVVLIWIHASLIENQLRLKVAQNPWHVLAEHSQVLFISRVVFQCHIHAARFLAQRIILLTVNREGENIRIAVEDGSGAVALMHITIND